MQGAGFRVLGLSVSVRGSGFRFEGFRFKAWPAVLSPPPFVKRKAFLRGSGCGPLPSEEQLSTSNGLLLVS